VTDFVRLIGAISAGNVCKYSLVIARPLLARGEGNAGLDLRIVLQKLPRWRRLARSTSIKPRRWIAGDWRQ
jgi:hypothetical protein